jgi:PAS domain S-box-containing protein
MISIDLRTLVFSFVITNIIVTLIIVMLWYQNRKRFSGTFLWVINFLFQTTALILISLRGIIPDWISMVVSNAIVIAGTILGLIALERFVGIKRNNLNNYILLVLFIFLSVWFSQVEPDLAIRNLNLAATMLIITFQCSWLIFFKVKGELRKIAAGVGVIFLAYSLINVLRIANFFITDHSVIDYFDSGKFEMFVIISYQMLFILLTYNLALMFNRRLLSDVANQEEKFSKAFHSSPYAMILTRLTDGKIFEVNKGFVDITGFRPSEVIGVTTNDLNIWHKEEERAVFMEELSRLGRVVEKELWFRKKSGEALICLMSSDIISINNERCVLSSINDITKRKKTEESLRETEAILKAAMDCSPLGIAIADAPSGNLRYVNKAGLMIPAKTEDEIVKDIDINKYVSSWNIKHHDGTPYKPDEVPLARAVKYGESVSREFIIARDENDDRIVLANAAPIVDDLGNVKAGIVVFQDITEAKITEKQLRDKVQELEKFNKTMVGRELKMVELKLEINELCGRLNLPARYKVAEGSENEKVIR